jgi:hypothetical protein
MFELFQFTDKVVDIGAQRSYLSLVSLDAQDQRRQSTAMAHPVDP